MKCIDILKDLVNIFYSHRSNQAELQVDTTSLISETKSCLEPEESDPTCNHSLLDNTEYMSLAQQCCDMLIELDRMQNLVKNDEVIGFITQQKSRLREVLMLSGASLIADETEFNLCRHQRVNGGLTKNGTQIREIQEEGIEIDGRVMVKAKVII